LDLANLSGLTQQVKTDGYNNNGTLDNLLYIGLHTAQVQNIADNANNKGANNGSNGRTRTAGEAGSADNSGCNGVGLITLRRFRQTGI